MLLFDTNVLSVCTPPRRTPHLTSHVTGASQRRVGIHPRRSSLGVCVFRVLASDHMPSCTAITMESAESASLIFELAGSAWG